MNLPAGHLNVDESSHLHITPRVSRQSELLLEGKIDAKKYFEEVAPEGPPPALEEWRRSSQQVRWAAALLGLCSVLIFFVGAIDLLTKGRGFDAGFSFLGALALAFGFGQAFGRFYLNLFKRGER